MIGIHKIKHIIIIMQENRSFDTYFGTYPGADGIPRMHGQFTVCVPDPAKGNCVAPFHNPNDVNGGGPHGATNATADIDGGKMDGFIAQAERNKGCLNVERSGVREFGNAGCDGLSRWPRNSQLLGVCEGICLARPYV